MSDPQTGSGGHWFDPPPFMKAIYYWGASGAMLTTITALVISFLWRARDTHFIASLAVALAFFVYVVWVLIRDKILANRAVLEILSTTKYTRAEERQQAISGLERSSLFTQIGIIFLLFVALASCGLLLWRPIYYVLSERRPESVKFKSLRYLDPERDKPMLDESPFMAAVIANLKDEGQAEDRSTRIVLATTNAFPHPTPRFLLSISAKDQTQEFAAYAFREHRVAQRLFFESVPVSYPQKGLIGFRLPPCDPGDEILIISRLSLADKLDHFPTNLNGVLDLSISEAH